MNLTRNQIEEFYAAGDSAESLALLLWLFALGGRRRRNRRLHPRDASEPMVVIEDVVHRPEGPPELVVCRDYRHFLEDVAPRCEELWGQSFEPLNDDALMDFIAESRVRAGLPLSTPKKYGSAFSRTMIQAAHDRMSTLICAIQWNLIVTLGPDAPDVVCDALLSSWTGWREQPPGWLCGVLNALRTRCNDDFRGRVELRRLGPPGASLVEYELHREKAAVLARIDERGGDSSAHMIRVSVILDRLGVASRTWNKYADDAGVRTAGRGQSNFELPRSDIDKVLVEMQSRGGNKALRAAATKLRIDKEIDKEIEESTIRAGGR